MANSQTLTTTNTTTTTTTTASDHNLQALPFPLEIIIVILKYTIRRYPDITVCVLSTCSLFHNICQNILHQDLEFSSITQLHRFTHVLLGRQDDHNVSQMKPYLFCPPRSLSLEFAGGAAVKGMIEDLNTTVNPSVVRTNQLIRGEQITNERLAVESVRLRLNSHAQDAKDVVYDALCELDARSFTWRGPDPPHHFSIAIVRDAVPPLFRALSTYTQLTHLELTNISFPEQCAESSETSTSAHQLELPFIPSLRYFHLGQSTFLAAPVMARFVLTCIYPERYLRGASIPPDSAGNRSRNVELQDVSFQSVKRSSIEVIRLVDVYEGSIWGTRLRIPRIIEAALTLLKMDQDQNPKANTPTINDTQEAIVKLVKVEVETERILGGDRGI
ncbi:hypothetical protein L218DRAFT_932291 [Marasmius fiardii PR-910]|nr:hypothetical protein L218DRAFT_932291 [Marasmius fiardii PR-910]